jgi:hypothetical protein
MVIALKIIAGALIVALWGYGLYVRGGYAVFSLVDLFAITGHSAGTEN